MKRRLLRSAAILLLAVLIVLGLGRCGVELYAAYHIREADRILQKQDYEAAKPHLEAALKVRPNSATLHLRLGRLCRQLGLLDDAERHLVRCHQLEGQTEDYQLEMLMLQAQRGQLDEVHDRLIVYVKEDKMPQAGLVLESMVLAVKRVQLHGPAYFFADSWVKKDPTNIQAQWLLGVCKAEVSDVAGAVETLEATLEKAPERDDIRQSLGMALLEVHSYKRAAEHLERCLKKHPEDATLKVGLARCYLGQGEVVKGRDILDQAIADGQGDNTFLLAERGKVALLLQEPREAEKLLRRALELDPANVTAAYQLEVCLTTLDRPQEAAEIAKQRTRTEADFHRIEDILTKELNKGTSPALFHELGTLLVRNDRLMVGLTWLYKALKLDPSYQPTNEFLADFFERRGDRERAQQYRAMLPKE
jgi:tetratricopeptide (TPR) repeat protein